jgi:hypothetical protein
MQARRTVVLRAAFVLLAGWAVWRSAAQSETGLSVEIRDDATGEIVPAMACITSVADGTWRVPPDGAAEPPYSTLRFFYEPQPWRAGQIGPVRKTSGAPDDNQSRSAVYDGRQSYPYWREPAIYFVPQPFSIRLAAGRWRLAVARGLEYVPVREEIEIPAGAQVRRSIRLKRWVNMPRGWLVFRGHARTLSADHGGAERFYPDVGTRRGRTSHERSQLRRY